jgi:uncharacterized membrane-anchored protein
MRKAIAVASILLFLAGFAWSVFTKEDQVINGKTIIVRLAPRDPRAFLLGDYMQLNYALNLDVDRALSLPGRNRENMANFPRDGVAIVKVDTNRVATFHRLENGELLQDGEHRIYFRVGKGGARIAADRFYFQEGHSKAYDRAAFGELRVDANGRSLLVYMRDNNLKRIIPRKSDRNDEPPIPDTNPEEIDDGDIPPEAPPENTPPH